MPTRFSLDAKGNRNELPDLWLFCGDDVYGLGVSVRMPALRNVFRGVPIGLLPTGCSYRSSPGSIPIGLAPKPRPTINRREAGVQNMHSERFAICTASHSISIGLLLGTQTSDIHHSFPL